MYDSYIPQNYLSSHKSLFPPSGDSIAISKWYNDLGVHYYNTLKPDSAVKYYNLSMIYNSQYTMPLRNRFLLHNFYHDNNMALEDLRLLSSKGDKPDNLKKFFNAWDKALRAEGKTDSAIIILKKWIEIDPTEPQAYSNLGTYYILAKNKNEAVNMWKKAIAVDPSYKHGYALLFNFYYNENNYDLARQYADKALSLGIRLDPKVLAKVNAK
jgi:tetratricopeptide (TPR) repeat protein